MGDLDFVVDLLFPAQIAAPPRLSSRVDAV